MLRQEDFCSYIFDDEEKKKSLQEALDTYKDDATWKACALIPYLKIEDDELEQLRIFISEEFNKFLVVKNNHATLFKKLICFYDWRKYGW